MLQQNMKHKQTRLHPNEKPIQLYKFLFDKYLSPGDVVIDPYGGSMSIALAAHDMGVSLDICEKDPHYFNAAVERFKIHERQLTMF